MSKNTNHFISPFFAIIFLLLPFLAPVSFSQGAGRDLDPTPEEILTKHARSIGSETKLTEAFSRIAIGTSEFVITLPESRAAGKALFASNAENAMLISSFDLAEYPFEKIGFFRGKVEIPFIQPGSRSPIGSYLLLNDNILDEKLFGGAICSSWRMMDIKSALERLRFGGKKKIAGREAYILRFNSKSASSSNSGIELYFDAKDFRHLRTEYRQKMPDKNFYMTGIFGNQTGENINTLTEDFEDFKTVGGLTLPHKYKITLVIDGRAGTKEFQWHFKFDEYRIGQNFGADFFTFDKK